MKKFLILALLLFSNASSAQLAGGLIFPGPGTPAASSSTPFAITYVGTATPPSSTAGTSPVSIASVPIGTADATRIVAVGILLKTTGAGQTITAVTIAGVTATQATSAGASTTVAAADWWYAAIPAGTTGTVVVTTSGTAWNRLVLLPYNVIGTSSAFAAAVGAASASAISLGSGSITAPSGGGTIGIFIEAAATAVVTSNNLTQDVQSTQGTNIAVASSDISHAGSPTTYSFSWSPNSAAAASFITFSP